TLLRALARLFSPPNSQPKRRAPPRVSPRRLTKFVVFSHVRGATPSRNWCPLVWRSLSRSIGFFDAGYEAVPLGRPSAPRHAAFLMYRYLCNLQKIIEYRHFFSNTC